MNFLVTGGAGFIGSHVCERLLQSGHAVRAFDDLDDFYDPQIKRRNIREIQSLGRDFEFVQGDLMDRVALDELFTPIPYIVPAQLLAESLAEEKGLNPDQPRALSKVTRTL